MRFVTSTAHEFLVLGRRGKLRNLGAAARAFLRPGDVCVRVAGTKQEACFAMTQESDLPPCVSGGTQARHRIG